MQLYVHVHVGRFLSSYHSLSSLFSCFYLPVFFSLTYTSSIMAPSGLLFQSSIMNSSSGSPIPPRKVSLDQLNKIKQVNLAHNLNNLCSCISKIIHHNNNNINYRHILKSVTYCSRHPWNIFRPLEYSYIDMMRVMCIVDHWTLLDTH